MCAICEYRAPIIEGCDACSECLQCVYPAGYDIVPLCETGLPLSLLPNGERR